MTGLHNTARARQGSLAQLTHRRHGVQAKLDRDYDDYLDGRISDDFWRRKSGEWEGDMRAIDAALARLERPTPTFSVTAERILELAKTAHPLNRSTFCH